MRPLIASLIVSFMILFNSIELSSGTPPKRKGKEKNVKNLSRRAESSSSTDPFPIVHDTFVVQPDTESHRPKVENNPRYPTTGAYSNRPRQVDPMYPYPIVHNSVVATSEHAHVNFSRFPPNYFNHNPSAAEYGYTHAPLNDYREPIDLRRFPPNYFHTNSENTGFNQN